MKRMNKCVLMLIAALVLFSLSSEALAQRPRMGLQFGMGGGTYAPIDPEEYFDKATMLALDFQLFFDISGIRLGLTVGYTPLVVDLTYTDGWGFTYTDQFTYVFLPIMGDFSVMPLRFFMPNLAFQFLVGAHLGVFNWSVLDEEDIGDSHFAFGPKLGLEFFVGEWFVIGLEGRYVMVTADSEYPDSNLGFMNALLSLRFRIPLIKREF